MVKQKKSINTNRFTSGLSANRDYLFTAIAAKKTGLTDIFSPPCTTVADAMPGIARRTASRFRARAYFVNFTTKPPPGAIGRSSLSPAFTVLVSWTYFIGCVALSGASRKISAFHSPSPRNAVSSV